MGRKEARVFIPQVATELAELVRSGSFKPSLFDLADGNYTKEFAEKVQLLRRFEIGARPLEVPKDLLDLLPDAEVLIRQNGIDNVATASHTVGVLREIIQRQARGFFELHEAASIMAEVYTNASGLPILAGEVADDMKDAFLVGELAFYDEVKRPIDIEKLRRTSSELLMLYDRSCNHLGMYGETTTPAAINAWLESSRSPYRFPAATTDTAGANDPRKRPRNQQPDQEARIIAKLIEHGYDPKKMPRAPLGNKPWPLRESVRLELGYSTEVMKKAWTRLRAEDRIMDA